MGSLLPGGIRMGEVDVAFFERICKTAELIAVIAGNASEDLGTEDAGQPLRRLLSCWEALTENI